MPKTRKRRPKGSAPKRTRNGKVKRRPARVAKARAPRLAAVSRQLQPLGRKSAFQLDDGEPRVERNDPEMPIPGLTSDDLAEGLGEEFVEGVTSGEDVAEDVRDEVLPEEEGGPFVITSARTEFAYDTDESNPSDAEPAALPTVSPIRPGSRPRS